MEYELKNLIPVHKLDYTEKNKYAYIYTIVYLRENLEKNFNKNVRIIILTIL